jgi:NAD-dependent deacetylase
MTAAACREIARRLRAAARVTVLTGAGVSAASNVPTFRGAGGLWRQFRSEDLATAAAFRSDAHLVWEWYDWRRQVIAGCRPNAAHDVLAAWSTRRPGFTLVTQNVDGLHERAGTRHVIRLHGSIWRLRCWDGCGAHPRGWDDRRAPLPDLPPRCPACGGLARPGVVWFGEALDPADWQAAASAAHADVFFTIGTSAVVHPAASLTELARRGGAFTIEINPEATPASDAAHVALRAAAHEALPAIDAELRG